MDTQTTYTPRFTSADLSSQITDRIQLVRLYIYNHQSRRGWERIRKNTGIDISTLFPTSAMNTLFDCSGFRRYGSPIAIGGVQSVFPVHLESLSLNIHSSNKTTQVCSSINTR